MVRKLIDGIWISTEGLLIPWEVAEHMLESYSYIIDAYKKANAPQSKIDYRRGQKAVFETVLSYKENIIEESRYENVPELEKDYNETI